MDKELKAKWVEALRGGAFKQTTGTYWNFHRDAYCCLGVLVKLARESDPDITIWEAEQSVATTSQMRELIKMNDTGQTFAEIADYIEMNL